MRGILSRPYPYWRSPSAHARSAVLFGLFVFAFLYLFRPFGLYFMEPMLLRVTLGYGAVCTGVMLLLNVVVPRGLPNWFTETGWTVGREMGWTAMNVACIGLANGLYTAALGLAPLNATTVLLFTGYTFIVGIFPVALSILLNELRLSRLNVRRSAAINASMAQAGDPEPTAQGGLVRIAAEQEKDDLVLDANDLVLVRAADNYVEVYHRSGSTMQRTVIRSSLKAVAEALAGHDRFMRCHKSHLVDLRKVLRVSGNAQGLRLHLAGLEEPVPVSRQLTAEVRQRLAVGP